MLWGVGQVCAGSVPKRFAQLIHSSGCMFLEKKKMREREIDSFQEGDVFIEIERQQGMCARVSQHIRGWG